MADVVIRGLSDAAVAHIDAAAAAQGLSRQEYLTRVALRSWRIDRGLHRAPSVPDLLIAATAEVAGLTVLSLDKDFSLIAQISGQPVEALRMA